MGGGVELLVKASAHTAFILLRHPHLVWPLTRAQGAFPVMAQISNLSDFCKTSPYTWLESFGPLTHPWPFPHFPWMPAVPSRFRLHAG